MRKCSPLRKRVAAYVRFLLLVSLALCASACGSRRPARDSADGTGGPAAAPGLSAARLKGAIELAAGYLERNCRADGRFVYRRYLDSKRPGDDRYNVLRHAGALYALGVYYQRTPDPKTLAAMLRAAKYLRAGIRPVGGSKDMLALWSPESELTGREKGRPPVAKLGGAGLALVALSQTRRAQPDSAPLGELRGLGRFVLRMQKKDGSFYCKYFEGEGPDDRWTSLYYPGEAMLGLLCLHDLDPRSVWLGAAAEGMACLGRSRARQRTAPADHWALLATQKLLAKYDLLERPPATRAQMVAHAALICEGILREQVEAPGTSRLRGAFTSDGRTCPTATRLEGLLSALSFLPLGESPVRTRTADAVHRGMAFLVNAQVPSGPMRGAFPYAAQVPPDSHGSHSSDRRRGEVRIDYVQHALCAMLQYERFFSPS